MTNIRELPDGPEKDSILQLIRGFQARPEQHPLPYVWTLSAYGVESLAIGTQHLNGLQYQDDIGKRLQGKKNVLVESIRPTNAEHPLRQRFELFLNENFLSDQIKHVGRLYRSVEPLLHNSVDSLCINTGRMNGANVQPLEDNTALDSLIGRIFESISMAVKTHKDLIDSLLPLCSEETVCTKIEEIRQEYQNGMLRPVPDFVQATLGELFNEINARRNRAMVDRSMTYLREPSVVAVGSQHFLSPPTMLSMYEDAGVEVRRID